MNLIKPFIAIVLNFALISGLFLTLAVETATAQDARVALQRGFRTGYSDGYMAGYRDSAQRGERNIQGHTEYAKADRAYAQGYGALEDYRDGYQQGFESGYATGFEKRGFDSTIPFELKKRGTVAVTSVTNNGAIPPVSTNSTIAANTTTVTSTIPAPETTNNNNPLDTNVPAPTQTTDTTTQNNLTAMLDGQVIIIPKDTELIVELINPIGTGENRDGDKFQAKVVSPYEISGAIIEGRVDKIEKPGRIKKRAELQLKFDEIRLNQARWSNMNAILTEVLPVKGDNVKKVDNEGSAIGKSSLKPDAMKIGAATGTGIVIGAVVGGPVGAGVGAAMGAAFGVGAVVVERGKHIKLIQGQQLRIRTVYETQIR